MGFRSIVLAWPLFLYFVASASAVDAFVPLFPEEGVPRSWHFTDWSDVSRPAPEGAEWEVRDGILHGSSPRGTWLVSDREYGDFVLELEFKLGARGNSGVGLRFPPAGDPAFDGLEVQIVDPRYYGDAPVDATQLAGSIYPLLAAREQVFRPEAWNKYTITCRGPRVTVVLNGHTIQDVNLDEQTTVPERGSALKDRPRRGHIGFQELSRGGTHVEIRAARIKELGEPASAKNGTGPNSK